MTITTSVQKYVDQWINEYKQRCDLYESVRTIVDRALIDATLKHTRGNQSQAAKVLGINRNTLLKKMRKLKGATK